MYVTCGEKRGEFLYL